MSYSDSFFFPLKEFIYSIVASGSLLITAILNIGFSCKAENRAALSYFSSYLSTSYFGTYITAGVSILFSEHTLQNIATKKKILKPGVKLFESLAELNRFMGIGDFN